MIISETLNEIRLQTMLMVLYFSRANKILAFIQVTQSIHVYHMSTSSCGVSCHFVQYTKHTYSFHSSGISISEISQLFQLQLYSDPTAHYIYQYCIKHRFPLRIVVAIGNLCCTQLELLLHLISLQLYMIDRMRQPVKLQK